MAWRLAGIPQLNDDLMSDSNRDRTATTWFLKEPSRGAAMLRSAPAGRDHLWDCDSCAPRCRRTWGGV